MFTKFMKKERDAQDAMQKLVNEYGLYVDRTTCGGVYNEDGTAFCEQVWTLPQEVKGKKELIAKLEKAGFVVYKILRASDDTHEHRYYVFIVSKVFPIILEDDDHKEYIENPERPEPFMPVVGVTYANRGGGLYRCLRLTLIGNNVTATFINTRSGWKFQACGIRKYKDGTIEWDYSNGGAFSTDTE